MSREYGQIQSGFWQSDDAGKLSDAGKLLAAYLLTGPHTNGLGCFKLPLGYLAEDLGWSSEKVADAFVEMASIGFAYRFGSLVFIPKFLAWNRISNPKVAKAREGEWNGLPTGEAKSRAARALLEFGAHLSEVFAKQLTDEKKPSRNPIETESKQEPTRTYPEPTQPRATVKLSLPDWLPPSAWSDFVKHRKAIKKPLTAVAETRMLTRLATLRGEGVDVLAAMDTAIRSGWSDVYAPKPGGKPTAPVGGFSRASDL